MSAFSPLWVPVIAAYLSIAWAAALHHCWGRRRYGLASIDYWAWGGGFLTLALMLTLPLPPVMAEVDRLTGLVGLADTLADGCALLTGLAWLTYLARLVPPGDRRLWRRRGGWVPLRALVLLAIAASAVLAGRFLWAPGRLGFRLGPHADAAQRYLAFAHLTYRIVSLALLGCIIVVLRRLGTIAAAQTALRLRLRAIRWVLWYLIGYIAYESASTVVWALPDLSSRVFRLRSLLLLAVIVAPDRWYLTGLALWRRCGGLLAGLSARWRAWRDWRRLYPLWATLYPVRPTISLLPPPSRRRAWFPGRPLRFALCRQVAEIRDWELRLWRHQAPRAVMVAEEVAREAGLPERAAATFVGAVTLAAALEHWRTARPALVRTAGPPPGRMAGGGATLGEELAALLPIADIFARSPLLAEALARLGEEPPVSGHPTPGLPNPAAGAAQRS